MNIAINIVGFLMMLYMFGPEASQRDTWIKTFAATFWNYKWVFVIWFVGAILMDVNI